MEEDKIIDLLTVYMPCNGRDNLDEFEHVLAQLSSTIKTTNATYIGMIGDFNADLKPGSTSLFGKELGKFSEHENMIISDLDFCSKDAFTFLSDAHQTVSWIDHCVSNANLHI